MLEVKGLCKQYRPKKGVAVQALKDINIRFPETGMVFLLGRSGSGKSTLLNLLGGLDRYDSGEILLDGESTKKFSQADFDSYRNACLGFVFQEFYLISHQSVLYNVISPLLFEKGRKLRDCKKAALQALEYVGMRQFARRKIDTLSGGQKQRVAIARALVNHPSLLLCDEPTGSLDSRTAAEILELLEKENRSGTTIFLVTHDTSISFDNAKVIEISDGQIV